MREKREKSLTSASATETGNVPDVDVSGRSSSISICDSSVSLNNPNGNECGSFSPSSKDAILCAQRRRKVTDCIG